MGGGRRARARGAAAVPVARAGRGRRRRARGARPGRPGRGGGRCQARATSLASARQAALPLTGSSLAWGSTAWR